MRCTQYCGQHFILDVAIVQQFWEIIVILKEGIKHFLFILSQQQEELLLSHLTLEELKLFIVQI